MFFRRMLSAIKHGLVKLGGRSVRLIMSGWGYLGGQHNTILALCGILTTIFVALTLYVTKKAYLDLQPSVEKVKEEAKADKERELAEKERERIEAQEVDRRIRENERIVALAWLDTVNQQRAAAESNRDTIQKQADLARRLSAMEANNLQVRATELAQENARLAETGAALKRDVAALASERQAALQEAKREEELSILQDIGEHFEDFERGYDTLVLISGVFVPSREDGKSTVLYEQSEGYFPIRGGIIAETLDEEAFRGPLKMEWLALEKDGAPGIQVEGHDLALRIVAEPNLIAEMDRLARLCGVVGGDLSDHESNYFERMDKASSLFQPTHLMATCRVGSITNNKNALFVYSRLLARHMLSIFVKRNMPFFAESVEEPARHEELRLARRFSSAKRAQSLQGTTRTSDFDLSFELEHSAHSVNPLIYQNQFGIPVGLQKERLELAAKEESLPSQVDPAPNSEKQETLDEMFRKDSDAVFARMKVADRNAWSEVIEHPLSSSEITRTLSVIDEIVKTASEIGAEKKGPAEQVVGACDWDALILRRQLIDVGNVEKIPLNGEAWVEYLPMSPKLRDWFAVWPQKMSSCFGLLRLAIGVREQTLSGEIESYRKTTLDKPLRADER